MKRAFVAVLIGWAVLASDAVWSSDHGTYCTPDVFKVVMKKVEVSTDGQAWVTLASGDSEIDIAQASAGQKAADYGSNVQLPIGTYTRVRATISNTITLMSSDSGTAVTDDASPFYPDRAVRFFYTTTAGHQIANCTQCTDQAADLDEQAMTFTDSTGWPPEVTLDVGAGTITILQDISFTVAAGAAPKIRISFGVDLAMEFSTFNHGPGAYDKFTPRPPTVTIQQL